MSKKRKRPSKASGPASQTSLTAAPNRFKSSKESVARNIRTTHPVISLYYREVLTLRQYLLNQLPASSKLRRRRIASLRLSPERSNVQPLADLLDFTLVGVLKEPSPKIDSDRQRGYREFTQSQSRSVLVSTDTGSTSPQSEVVDFVIGQLFKQQSKPVHILTHGFQRSSMGNDDLETKIPGIMIQFSNQNVETLQKSPWTEILDLLGQNGDEIMMRLLFDCGIFAPIDAQRGIYYQLSGQPLSFLEPVQASCARPGESISEPKPSVKTKRPDRQEIRSPNSITFLRRSMLYSRHATWSNEKLVVGLGRTHVFNRFRDLDSAAQTIHVMMYIFARQFGLRNVFTPTGDRSEQFVSHGHAFREDEIFAGGGCSKLPKRLRGQAVELAHSLRARQARCSYEELLRHYCPTEPNGPWKLGEASPIKNRVLGAELGSSIDESLVTQLKVKTPVCTNDRCPGPGSHSMEPSKAESACESRIQQPKLTLTHYATPASSVSAFCRAVLLNLIPSKFFGDGPEGLFNRKLIMRHVDSFIKLRRFESLSLHEVCIGLKVANISWLASPKLHNSHGGTDTKMAMSDFQKRTEMLHDFVYYIFDSILLPLVRANFYVTESQTHRNRLFYFRHDVWQRLTKQPLAKLKTTIFEEVEPSRAQRLLERRSLGVGSLRLLPKSTGLRPILNLRKRVLKESNWGGKKRSYLAASINSSLAPISNMLSYERKRQPTRLGSALQYVGDIHLKLRDFKRQLIEQLPEPKSSSLPKLFFVKLDIQGCFDTIPQKQLLGLIEELVSEETYHITKHVEMSPSAFDARGKPTRRYIGRAMPAMKQQALSDMVAEQGQCPKAKTVYIDTIQQKLHDADDLLGLLNQHVRNNLVKMGKQYFRQRSGIPQGSVLSNLLCNFFYGELEQQVLGFLRPADSVLLRLVDDFLLVTTDVDQAIQFLQVMIPGQPSYGVLVNPAKSLVNFTAAVKGTHIPRIEGSSLFPYCGILINTHTLEMIRDQDRLLEGGDSAATSLSDTLTVETSRIPGRTFRRKVLAPFRLQIHPMYLDDEHNSRSVVLANLHTSFITAAMKMYRYMKSLRGRSHPAPPIIIQTIYDLIHQTFRVIQTRRTSHSTPFSCFVQLWHLQYLAASAFRFVLKRKQTRYVAVLEWLDRLGKESRPNSNLKAVRMQQVVRKGIALFEQWRF
ncbi:Telomere reverse transcriptase [Penicillium odoratum]|uniref:Telomere reverse transcriptase n=1 Tax=Penicillium odoratum TaxID=1167516 RepID=UPI002547150E|nr:Telomere reverse transcriptase [Penicillium odoratum]KAJ5752542.1 Telomere reverse transcriptase [Penicillium odoratum]